MMMTPFKRIVVRILLAFGATLSMILGAQTLMTLDNAAFAPASESIAEPVNEPVEVVPLQIEIAPPAPLGENVSPPSTGAAPSIVIGVPDAVNPPPVENAAPSSGAIPRVEIRVPNSTSAAQAPTIQITVPNNDL